ncbi:MAG: putative phosphate transport protein (TIGR00153 family) [Myxococcota bacterium]|jgi:predicted phosphate transport protein (TIGR00153 family)
MPTISKLFGGHSPFTVLQKHMRVVRKCAEQVIPLLDALLEEDRETVEIIAKQISELESEADLLKHELRIHLPRSLFMPVDRRDLLEVLHTQDSIADVAEDIAEMFVNRRMVVPQQVQETLRAMTKRCVEVVVQASELIEHIDELLVVGFKGRTAEKVEELAVAINEAENETDAFERELERIIFSLEDELSPVSVMFWYRLIGWIGDLADHAEKIGNTIRLIIAR